MTKRTTIYFAHPIRTYHSKEEEDIIRLLLQVYPKAKIINPGTMPMVSKFRGCEDCMKHAMRPIFFKQIKRCTIFVIWNPIDSCGIRCELHKAWELGKKVLHFTTTTQYEEICLQTYHYQP